VIGELIAGRAVWRVNTSAMYRRMLDDINVTHLRYRRPRIRGYHQCKKCRSESESVETENRESPRDAEILK
jgi:hypothetical protein